MIGEACIGSAAALLLCCHVIERQVTPKQYQQADIQEIQHWRLRLLLVSVQFDLVDNTWPPEGADAQMSRYLHTPKYLACSVNRESPPPDGVLCQMTKTAYDPR
jgi:hypothetical protein